MHIDPVAIFHSPLKEKFGIPRQAGLAGTLRGTVVLEPQFRSPDALRGLEGFDYLWLLWGFNLNREGAASGSLTVRPPRLGGNERIGVFASRSPYRPNPIGLSSVKIESIDPHTGTITVLGADLADGTPVFDIKPYVEYADSHVGVRSGFTDTTAWEPLEVEIAPELLAGISTEDESAIRELLRQDPRPRYQEDPERLYGMSYGSYDVKFKVSANKLTVKEIIKI